ncbi:hypothetical protein EMM73_19740 [Rheinheimera sediminis]|uniref:hypothetical protein n=1 Tax=Rheinheimera sp. YQF-1 TaxID=2499626 RepID=UPI000FD82545|nr:hypothetical protein [Rheinheimera sp. YQF-1]RVT40087.1 hypothetical protein EMM73_19740 [Rheinheimera sp. YQF-1]
MNAFNNITKLFSSGNLPVVISDSNYVMNSFAKEGFEVCSVSEAYKELKAPAEVILAIVDPSSSPSHEVFDKTFKNSAVLVCPLMSFASDSESVDYFISTLKKIDFESACINGKKRLEQLEGLNAPLTVKSGDKFLEIRLGDNIEVFAPKINPIIKLGEWISVSQFLEIALIPNADYSCFNVNGEFTCEGISIAFHRNNYEISGPLAKEAWNIFTEIRKSGGFPLKLILVDSEVKSIETTFGEQILDKIKPLTDETFHGKLIEVAFASLEASKDTNWLINSQLNEAAGGVHLALGTGVKAAHIDFICPRATVLETAT